MMGYAPQQQQWNQQQQQQWNQQQQQQWNQQTQQQSYQAAAPATAAAADNTIGSAANFVVTGCTHATVGVIARGSYTLNAENHGRRTYKRDSQVNGLDVMIYFWDERDGPNFCGWWFGPKVGGDQVWAYHPDKAAQTPPKSGWKVPYDGPVDPTFLISPSKPATAAGTPQQQAPAAQQNQWQQQAQQQNQWQQPAQQQNQWQAQQAAQLAQQKQAQLAQQNQHLEEQKKKFAALREQQMAQQKQRLEENRQKLEEANKKRIEEQQQKMAALKEQQILLAQKAAEERKKKEEELEKKRDESRAALAVRKVLAKLRIAQGRESVETVKKELEETMAKELGALYTMTDKIKEECEQVTKIADTRLEQIEAARKKAEEMKAAEDKKRQEEKEKAEQLVAELAGLIAQAEEANKAFAAESEPLTSSADLTVEQIQAAGESCEAAGAEVKLKSKACTDFIAKNSKEMKLSVLPSKPKGEGEENKENDKPQLSDLLKKISEVQKSSEQLGRNIGILKPKAEKKAAAKRKLSAIQKTFLKYDKDGDGMLSKKELAAYAKGEFAFSVPSAEVDSMCHMLVEEGKKGVPAESFARLSAYVGILREKTKDAKRKEKRLSHEKEIADIKEKLKTTIEEVSTVVTEATEKITEMEGACAPLPSKIKALKSQEMGPLADETATIVEAAKSLVAKARKMVADLGENTKEELKGFIASESAKLTSRMSKFDGHVAKCESIISKFRAEVSKKDQEELEAFRLAAIKKIRKYQEGNQVKPVDVIKKMNKKGDGKVNESEFVKFLTTTCKSSNADVEEEEEEVELSQDDISRLFAYLDEEEAGALTAEIVTSLIRCYMKVAKETVITTEKNIQEAKPIRRIEVGEVCYVVEGPVKEDTVGVMRYLVKSMKDETEGWVTPVGNQGTKFLEEAVGGLIMKVVKETILTASFEICSDAGKEQFRKLKDTTRKLKPGEQVEVLQWMKKDETSGLMRAKVKTKVGNHVGWATAVGNNGAPFLELA